MSDSDIPADVMERARSVQRELGGFNRYPSTAAIYIAQALLSERQRALEEAAKIALAAQTRDLGVAPTEYKDGHFVACGRIASAIRSAS